MTTVGKTRRKKKRKNRVMMKMTQTMKTNVMCVEKTVNLYAVISVLKSTTLTAMNHQ